MKHFVGAVGDGQWSFDFGVWHFPTRLVAPGTVDLDADVEGPYKHNCVGTYNGNWILKVAFGVLGWPFVAFERGELVFVRFWGNWLDEVVACSVLSLLIKSSCNFLVWHSWSTSYSRRSMRMRAPVSWSDTVACLVAVSLPFFQAEFFLFTPFYCRLMCFVRIGTLFILRDLPCGGAGSCTSIHFWVSVFKRTRAFDWSVPSFSPCGPGWGSSPSSTGAVS